MLKFEKKCKIPYIGYCIMVQLDLSLYHQLTIKTTTAMKKTEKVKVATKYGTVDCRANVDSRSPYHLSGALLGSKIFKAVEDGEVVSVEGYGQFQVSKTPPTWLEDGKVTLILP